MNGNEEKKNGIKGLVSERSAYEWEISDMHEMKCVANTYASRLIAPQYAAGGE